MTGILKTQVLGRVTNVADGVVKATGKTWFRASLSVNLYNFSTKKYYNEMVNVAGFDKVAEAMKAKIKPGWVLWAEGFAKPGKPFKTNSGQEITPLDLVARDWSLAGFIPDREEQPAKDEEETDASDPFAN